MQQKRGGAYSVVAVEMSSGRAKGMVKWFNATKGSGFVTPDNGGFLRFHQPSLKSDERDGYRGINISDSIEFDIRADWDGCPRAFNITAPGGGVLTSSFHPDGGSRCDDARYGKDNDLGDGGASSYDGGSGRGFHSCIGEVAALSMLSAGTAHQVFDEMSLPDVVWDEELLHEHDTYLHDFCSGSRTSVREILRSVDASWAGSVQADDEVIWDEEPLHDIDSQNAELLDEQPLADVVWDDKPQHGLHLHLGLLDQIAQGGTNFIDEDQKLIPILDFSELAQFSDVQLELVVEPVCEEMYFEEKTTEQMELIGHLAVAWDRDAENLLEKMHPDNHAEVQVEHFALQAQFVSKNAVQDVLRETEKKIVWDEDMLYSLHVHDNLLQQTTLDGQYSNHEKTKPIVVVNITEQKFEQVGGNLPNTEVCVSGAKESGTMLIHVGCSSQFPEHSTPHADSLFDEIDRKVVWDVDLVLGIDTDGSLPNQLAGKCNDNMMLGDVSNAELPLVLATEFDIARSSSLFQKDNMVNAGYKFWDMLELRLFDADLMFDEIHDKRMLKQVLVESDWQPQKCKKANFSMRQWDPGIHNSILADAGVIWRYFAVVLVSELVYILVLLQLMQVFSVCTICPTDVKTQLEHTTSSTSTRVWLRLRAFLVSIELSMSEFKLLSQDGQICAYHSVAWGQATFWRAGNVTPEPYDTMDFYTTKSKPIAAQVGKQLLYKSANRDTKEETRKISESGSFPIGGRLPRGGSIPAAVRPSRSAATPCPHAHVSVVARRWPRAVTDPSTPLQPAVFSLTAAAAS